MRAEEELKQMYRDLYEPVPLPPRTDGKPKGEGKDNQGKQKHGYVESDPTARQAEWANEEGRLTAAGRKRRDFDRAHYFLTTGVDKQVDKATPLMLSDAQKDAQRDGPDGAQGETNPNYLVDRAAPTVRGYAQRQHVKRLTAAEARQAAIREQSEWKAAGIE